jgi:hypothetical protein
MKDWRREYDKGLEIIKEECREGAAFELIVVPANALESLVDDANKGDRTAQRVGMAIDYWYKTADAARENGALPSCTSCERQLDYGDVSGWTVILPMTSKRSGMCGAFCDDCLQFGPGTIVKNTLRALAEHGDVQSIH